MFNRAVIFFVGMLVAPPQSAWGHPAGASVHHAEKPVDDREVNLSANGCENAQVLAAFFATKPVTREWGH